MSQLLKTLSFTTKELATFTGVSPSMINHIRRGTKSCSKEVTQKIIAYIQLKIETLQGMIAQIETDIGQR